MNFYYENSEVIKVKSDKLLFLNPLVSIQIPTYSQKQYIKEALDSALAQTYENLQIIVSDDCSPDYDIFEYLKDYADNPKVQIHRNEKNLGRVGNYRNTLYNLVQGEWFVNLDGDDYFTNFSFIETAIRFLVNVDNAVLFQAGAWTKQIDKGNVSGTKLEDNIYIVNGVDYIGRFQYDLGFTHGSLVYKADVAKRLNFYDFDALDIDHFSYLRMLNEGDLVLWSEKVYNWREHVAQETHLLNFKQALIKFDELEDLKRYYKDLPKYHKKQFFAHKKYVLCIELLKLFFKEDFSFKNLYYLIRKTNLRITYIISALSLFKHKILSSNK